MDQMGPKREFMMQAIAKMRESRSEDADPHPNVGMVVVKDGKAIGKASRGEWVLGEHAEFGGLQHRLEHRDLRGAMLYTTLEPCTTRKHPKLACAEWIVSRRIKEVVIGILDPNPAICGQGFWMLHEAGVKVHFFPPDLAQQIHDANEEFFSFCRQLVMDGVPVPGTEAKHVAAEQDLVDSYVAQPDFPELCYVAGEWKPNVCFLTLPAPRRKAVKEWLNRNGIEQVAKEPRDIFIIKGTTNTNEHNLLLYYSGKPQSGWNTWLFPNRRRDYEQNLVERIRKHRAFLLQDLGAKSTTVLYVPNMPLTICLKTNRFAGEPLYRDIPLLYVFRYCYVTIDCPPPELLQREHSRTAGSYERRFRWMNPGSFERDDRIWNANADVVMTIDKVFEPALTNVPPSLGRRRIKELAPAQAAVQIRPET